MNCHEKNVYWFIKCIFEKLFSKEFFGLENYKIVKNYLKKLIFMKRFETFCIKDIINKMDL